MSEPPSAYDRFRERYAEGCVPWDDPLPPPEIMALADELAPGRGLDLGCGYGRAAIYLARCGWTMDGVDFVPQAIAVARQRARAAGVARRATFHVASAAVLDFLTPPYDLAIDIGCMHSFTAEMLAGYRAELVGLLPHGARYVLFAHLRSDEEGDDAPRGIPESTILGLLGRDFVLQRVERGTTQVEDKPPWNSGWFWFRRV